MAVMTSHDDRATATSHTVKTGNPRGRPRGSESRQLTAEQFDSIRSSLGRWSDHSIEIARLHLVEHRPVSTIANDFDVSRQLVNNIVNRAWKIWTLISGASRGVKVFSVVGNHVETWETVSVSLPSQLVPQIEKVQERIAHAYGACPGVDARITVSVQWPEVKQDAQGIHHRKIPGKKKPERMVVRKIRDVADNSGIIFLLDHPVLGGYKTWREGGELANHSLEFFYTCTTSMTDFAAAESVIDSFISATIKS